LEDIHLMQLPNDLSAPRVMSRYEVGFPLSFIINLRW
jgi:hypothetical protein